MTNPEQSLSTTVAIRPNLHITEDGERTSLLLHVDGTSLVNNEMIRLLAAEGFTPKTEFHVTALDIKPDSTAAKVLSAQRGTFLHYLENVQLEEWQLTPRNEFYMLLKHYTDEDEPRLSVIQMIDCPKLARFYEQLNGLFPTNQQLVVPPAHITLATKGSSRGIGLQSTDELMEIGRPIPLI